MTNRLLKRARMINTNYLPNSPKTTAYIVIWCVPPFSDCVNNLTSSIIHYLASQCLRHVPLTIISCMRNDDSEICTVMRCQMANGPGADTKRKLPHYSLQEVKLNNFNTIWNPWAHTLDPTPIFGHNTQWKRQLYLLDNAINCYGKDANETTVTSYR
jgi:hypothetical protein